MGQPQQQPHHLAVVEPQLLLVAEQRPQQHLDAVGLLLNQHQVIYDYLLSVIRPHYHLINIELFLSYYFDSYIKILHFEPLNP